MQAYKHYYEMVSIHEFSSTQVEIKVQTSNTTWTKTKLKARTRVTTCSVKFNLLGYWFTGKLHAALHSSSSSIGNVTHVCHFSYFKNERHPVVIGASLGGNLDT